jgi:HSP20 family molecular chaperone IbpA
MTVSRTWDRDSDWLRPFNLFDWDLSRFGAGGRPRRNWDITAPDHDWWPTMDYFETDDEYKFCYELPGVPRDKIHIGVHDGRLVVSGSVERTKEEEDMRARVQERVFGKFYRSIPLPANVDSEKCEAKYENGVLFVDVPKKAESAGKNITIK